MSIRIINGKVYKNGTFSEEDLVLKEGKISSASLRITASHCHPDLPE